MSSPARGLNKSVSDVQSRLTSKALRLHQKRLDELSDLNRSSLTELARQDSEQYFSSGKPKRREFVGHKNHDIEKILELGKEEEESAPN